MTAAVAVLLLLGCWPLAATGNFLHNAPMHVPRIGRRSDTEQPVGQPVRASKSLYYQLPRHYPRVGRKDPSMPMYRSSKTEHRPINDEELLALWRRAAILDEVNRYNGPRTMDTNYDTATTGKELYEPSGQYPAIDGATYDNVDLGSPYVRGARYDANFFRSLREDREPFEDGFRYTDTHPEGPDHDARDIVPSQGVVEDREGLLHSDCRGGQCAPHSELLERLVKSLLKEIISRRQQQAGDESVFRQTDGNAKVPEPRQLW